MLVAVFAGACDGGEEPSSGDSGENGDGGDGNGDDGNGDDGNGDGHSGEGGTVVPEADCSDRCAAKAESCQAPPAQALAACASVCAGSLTSDQLDCLEQSDCTDLFAAFTGEGSLCGIGGDGGDGGEGGEGGGNNGSDAEIGDSCECSNPDSDFQQCSGNDGPCGSDLICYVVFGEGTCSTPCEGYKETDTCPVGKCTVQLVNGVEVGSWCKL